MFRKNFAENRKSTFLYYYIEEKNYHIISHRTDFHNPYEILAIVQLRCFCVTSIQKHVP